jgi:hypothetical protein
MRALWRKQKKSSGQEPRGTQGNLCNNSLSNFHIKENLGGLGLIMGDNDNLATYSIDLLRNVEKDRIKPSYYPSKKENEVESEDEINPDPFTISQLCGDLTEEVMDDNSANLDGYWLMYPSRWRKPKRKRNSSTRTRLRRKKLFSNERCFLEL